MFQIEWRTVHLARDGRDSLAELVDSRHEIRPAHGDIVRRIGGGAELQRRRRQRLLRLEIDKLPLKILPAYRQRAD